MTSQTPTKGHMAHPSTSFCKRELFARAWMLLFDDKFREASKNGILVCGDRVWRRLFPRIFTYSADYPEKCAQPAVGHDLSR